MTKRSLTLAAIMLSLTAGGILAGFALANNQQPQQSENGPWNDPAIMNQCGKCCEPDFDAFCNEHLNMEPPFDCEAMLQEYMDLYCPCMQPTSPGGTTDSDRNREWSPADGQ